MQYYIHIVTDHERIVDPDGQEFSDLAAARAEASQCARDLMAEELRCGRVIPYRWQAQIAEQDGTVVHTISFASLLFGSGAERHWRKLDARHARLIARVNVTYAHAQASNAAIKHNLGELRDNLRRLAQLNGVI